MLITYFDGGCVKREDEGEFTRWWRRVEGGGWVLEQVYRRGVKKMGSEIIDFNCNFKLARKVYTFFARDGRDDFKWDPVRNAAWLWYPKSQRYRRVSELQYGFLKAKALKYLGKARSKT